MNAKTLKTNIDHTLSCIEENKYKHTDGKWLEELTTSIAPHINSWEVESAWHWKEWPDATKYGYNKKDVGIDVVAKRTDGKYIAIQCKSKQHIKENGVVKVKHILKDDMKSFLTLAAMRPELWHDYWLVTFGETKISKNAESLLHADRPLKTIYLDNDLKAQREGLSQDELEVLPPHSIQDSEIETRDQMQKKCIDKSLKKLKEHADNPSGKSARGHIILPCGTGKSRIALRIMESLTDIGQVSVILCPSIALVAQLKDEFLNHCHQKKMLLTMAVCSDQTVGQTKDLDKDQTADIGSSKTHEVKGLVSTDPDKIGQWIDAIQSDKKKMGVLFGTYQSSHKIAEAISKNPNRKLQVMIADEAHRTAGLKRVPGEEKKLRDFSVCHHESQFPVNYRVYMTATPKTYDETTHKKNQKWVVRSMDDPQVFGVELYRRSYMEAVENGWLTDYRIIAIGVQDQEAYDLANKLASESHDKLSTRDMLSGLTLALLMGGAVPDKEVKIRSSISFMNTVKKSEQMKEALQTETVRDWVKNYISKIEENRNVNHYQLEHLDAKSHAASRKQAKHRLSLGTEEAPHGVLNVGIFGEGVDAPSLSAIAFLEARKSPVEVIQAVGRVMRRSKNKEKGYILCPLIIPPDVDAEEFLCNSEPEHGWKELGQILLALRAHDSRIEDKLSHLMEIYLPANDSPKEVHTMVSLGDPKPKRISYMDMLVRKIL